MGFFLFHMGLAMGQVNTHLSCTHYGTFDKLWCEHPRGASDHSRWETFNTNSGPGHGHTKYNARGYVTIGGFLSKSIQDIMDHATFFDELQIINDATSPWPTWRRITTTPLLPLHCRYQYIPQGCLLISFCSVGSVVSTINESWLTHDHHSTTTSTWPVPLRSSLFIFLHTSFCPISFGPLAWQNIVKFN